MRSTRRPYRNWVAFDRHVKLSISDARAISAFAFSASASQPLESEAGVLCALPCPAVPCRLVRPVELATMASCPRPEIFSVLPGKIEAIQTWLSTPHASDDVRYRSFGDPGPRRSSLSGGYSRHETSQEF